MNTNEEKETEKIENKMEVEDNIEKEKIWTRQEKSHMSMYYI